MFLKTDKIMQMFPMNNGIFYHINYQFPEVLSITSQQLDLAFLTSWGLRLCAPVVHVIHQNEVVSQLTQGELQQLGELILSIYKYKWDKLAEILSLQYDPIHNYSDEYHEELTEAIDADKTRTPDISVANSETVTIDRDEADGGSETVQKTISDSNTRTDNLSKTTAETVDTDRSESDGGTEGIQKTNSDTSTRTDNLSETIESSELNKIYGFNSLEDEPVGDSSTDSESTRLNTGTVGNTSQSSESSTRTRNLTHSVDETRDTDVTETQTGTVSDARQGTESSTTQKALTHTVDDSHVTSGTKRTTGTETEESSSDRTRVREFTHVGNIGNLTTQQLINQEIELWRWTLIQQVLNDVKDFLTLPVYD